MSDANADAIHAHARAQAHARAGVWDFGHFSRPRVGEDGGAVAGAIRGRGRVPQAVQGGRGVLVQFAHIF